MDIVFSEPVYNHTYTLKCLPQTTQTQEITECAVEVFPKGKMQESADSFGNRMLYGEAQEKQSCFSVDVTGMAKTGLYKQAAESDSERALYKYQTSLTSPGMQIQSLLGRLRKNSACSQKERIYSYMNAVYESMQYTKGVTSISTTAEEGFLWDRAYARIMRIFSCPCAGRKRSRRDMWWDCFSGRARAMRGLKHLTENAGGALIQQITG